MGRHLKSAGTASERQARAEAEAERQRAAEEAAERRMIEYGLACVEARDNLLRFAHIMKPHRAEPENPVLTRYQIAPHHRLLAGVLEDVEAGRKTRVIVTMPPRHGKSELTTRLLPAWFMGRNPHGQVIVGAYNDDKARDFGRDVLAVFKEPTFGHVFPSFALNPAAKAADHVRTLDGGEMLFAGIGGSATGYGANLLVIDDPIKNREEADSAANREKIWNWFLDVANTRLMPGGAIVIVLTRWHEDDLVGRIMNPAYVPEDLAAGWHIVNLPAIAEASDPLGRVPGEPLWPEWYGLERLEEVRRTNPRGFISLYQQRPAPEEGSYFRKSMIKTYAQDHLPKRLRYYGVSDHAATSDPQRDASCFIVFGVDEHDDVWIVDCWWGREEALTASARLLEMIKRWRPLQWFPANDNIFKTFRPFLDKRLREEEVWCVIDPIQEAKDIEARAQAIQGRMDQGRVRLPQGAYWLADATAELLSFPNAKHDDFVAAMALIGLALGRIIRASRPANTDRDPPPVGSVQWTIWAAKREEKARKKDRELLKWTA